MINITIDENINNIKINISPELPSVDVVVEGRNIDNEEAKKILIKALEGLDLLYD